MYFLKQVVTYDTRVFIIKEVEITSLAVELAPIVEQFLDDPDLSVPAHFSHTPPKLVIQQSLSVLWIRLLIQDFFSWLLLRELLFDESFVDLGTEAGTVEAFRGGTTTVCALTRKSPGATGDWV